MNIALEQTEEYINGTLQNKYGDAFVRGSNGTQRETTIALSYTFNLIQVFYIAQQ